MTRTHPFICIFMLGLCLAACRATPAGERLTATLTHDGVVRTYHVYLPSGFKTAAAPPLVIALHGGGGRGNTFDRGTTLGTLSAAAEERGVVLVFPEGIDRQWCDGRFTQLEPQSACATTDDVGFIAALIDTMVADYGIDPQRVYATGISNGGFMSFRLALDLSTKIAAVSPVTAQLSLAVADKTPQQPISVMLINGRADPLIPYDGGEVRLFENRRSRGAIMATDASVAYFRTHNGCDPTPDTVALPDADPEDGTTVTISTYGGCAAGTEVVLVAVDGGGHTWPGGKQYLGPDLIGVVSQELNASALILDFFLAHSLADAAGQ